VSKRLSSKQLHARVVKRLRKNDKLNFLESFAMFMGKAQLVELALKKILMTKYGYLESPNHQPAPSRSAGRPCVIFSPRAGRTSGRPWGGRRMGGPPERDGAGGGGRARPTSPGGRRAARHPHLDGRRDHAFEAHYPIGHQGTGSPSRFCQAASIEAAN
jgi:hypothetical protein